MIKNILKKIRKHAKYRKFLNDNRHNDIRLIEYNEFSNVKIGKYSYGRISLHDNKDGCKLTIGNFCSFGKNVFFCLGGEHNKEYVSTFPFKTKIYKDGIESYSKGNIIISDDVWVGVNVTFLSGVYVGQGAIIAAGSVVVGNVEPYSIYGGVPAKKIKDRFSPEIKNKLLKIDYNRISENFIKENKYIFQTKISEQNVDDILALLLNENLNYKE